MDVNKQLDLLKLVTRVGYSGAELTDLVAQLGERLNDLGVPISRLGVGFPILHPTLAGFDVTWQRGAEDVTHSQWRRSTSRDESFDFDALPFSHMRRRNLTELALDLTSDEPVRFPLVQRQKDAGATGYYATMEQISPNRRGGPLSVFFSSWTTDHPGGYTEDHLEVIRTLVPALGVAGRAISSYSVTHDLLATYLGRNAGRKVIEGSVERGTVEVIDAAILYCDLVGFTRTADQESKEDLSDLLNDYFDVLVGVIRDHDGEVLKFIGDGLLAIIPHNGDPKVAKSALDAAAAILRGIDDLRTTRAAAGKITADISIALHRGELLYGNVGSEDRLDFTVIGPAVNEASRIESLCRGQQRRLIISSAFAETAPDQADRLIAMGRFALRGVSKPQQLYTLDIDGQAA